MPTTSAIRRCPKAISPRCWPDVATMKFWPRRSGPRPAWSVAMLAAAALAFTGSAAARARGIVVSSCDGGHGSPGSGSPELMLSAEPATFNPGDSVALTLSIRWPSIRVGGAFITTAGVGTLRAVPGDGLTESAQGLTHSAPKAAVDGAVTFHFPWQAP